MNVNKYLCPECHSYNGEITNQVTICMGEYGAIVDTYYKCMDCEHTWSDEYKGV